MNKDFFIIPKAGLKEKDGLKIFYVNTEANEDMSNVKSDLLGGYKGSSRVHPLNEEYSEVEKPKFVTRLNISYSKVADLKDSFLVKVKSSKDKIEKLKDREGVRSVSEERVEEVFEEVTGVKKAFNEIDDKLIL